MGTVKPHFTGDLNTTFFFYQRVHAALKGANFLIAVIAALGAKLGALIASLCGSQHSGEPQHTDRSLIRSGAGNIIKRNKFRG